MPPRFHYLASAGYTRWLRSMTRPSPNALLRIYLTSSTMNTATIRDNHGYLHRINSKRHEKGPDMEGEAWIGSQHYEVAGWVNISKKGKKYLNLKFTKTNVSQ